MEELIFHCLEVSFRGLDLEYLWPGSQPAYTKHYQQVANMVSNSMGDETIADLLQAWIIHSYSDGSPKFLKPWAAFLIHIGHVASTSQRLRRLAIHSIVFLGVYHSSHLLEPGGVEGLIVLLDRLGIGINDVSAEDDQCRLLVPLLGVVRSLRGWQSLSYPYWELIPELTLSLAKLQHTFLYEKWLQIFRSPEGWSLESINYEVQVMVSLEEEQEWDRLECWMGFVWLVLRPKVNLVPEDVERVMLSLLRQRPGVTKKLEQWLQRANLGDAPDCLEYLWQVCERAGLEPASQQDAS